MKKSRQAVSGCDKKFRDARLAVAYLVCDPYEKIKQNARMEKQNHAYTQFFSLNSFG